MRLSKTLAIALRALRRNVTRSALTVLGIVIGIAAVIAMMEIGKGSSSSITKSIASMGANNLIVFPGTAASGGVSFGAGSVLTLTAEDCAAINQDCPAVAAAAPIVRVRTQVIFEDRNWVPQSIYGTTPAYLETASFQAARAERAAGFGSHPEYSRGPGLETVSHLDTRAGGVLDVTGFRQMLLARPA